MPSFSRGNDGLDKEHFEELQEKCRFLGISLKEKDFRKNPDKYIEAARNYDERVKDYLHERQARLKSLQEQFAREDNIPAFMALGKARMVLTGEVHRQMLAEKMAETAFAKIEEEYNFSVKDLHNKRNRDKFERLAYAFAISPQDLANQLQDAGNIGEALKNSDYQKEFLQLAFDNDAVKTIGGGGTGTAVVASGENADLAADVFAFIKLSDEANVEVWNVLGFDPVNTEVWTQTDITENPDNQYVKYFNTKPFDTLLEVQDGIGLLDCYTDEKMPSINNVFTTQTLNDIFESGVDVKEALDEAQDTLENEFAE